MGVKKKYAVRRESFDSLNLPEEFIIKEYRKALVEKGIKFSRNSVYGDIKSFEKSGKVIKLEKRRDHHYLFKIVRK